ncbi:sulfotransferase family 2 domain-containing protein [Kordiimonas sp.]|uniref:sulfotransferase family 2 domain-containing protein n=1 Tax=Kordiimonas sp. TaxID=1970157 RepID=UPI003A8F0712
MSVYNKALNIRYYPVPKVACTSVKQVLYTLEHGTNHGGGGIHKVYATLVFDLPQPERQPDELRIALVRDPIERFVSAYRNRVHGHEEAAHWKLRKQGLPLTLKPFPTLNEFVHDLADYQALVPSLEHHTLPMVTFLGANPEAYDHIFHLDNIGALETLLSERAGHTVRLPVTQTKGPAISSEALGTAEREMLRSYYQHDYAFLARLNAPALG